MKMLTNEEVLWTSKNSKLMLTSHRMREEDKSIFGSTIKSILLRDLSFSQLETRLDFGFLRKAVGYFVLINGFIYFLNQYLLKAELINVFFGEIQVGANLVIAAYYLSIVIAAVFILLFIFSYKKVFSFYAGAQSIQFRLRWMSFEEREHFISRVEEAKENLIRD